MLALLLLAALPSAAPSVRAELVEAPRVALADSGPSTGSGRTEEEKGSALDAERAFAADAQTLGQWTAFRKWAARDATMFVPQPINAQSWLKDRKDPAKAIAWWPTASYVSCDGSLAVNTGGWKRPDGAAGYFSTVWQRQPDGGWKWIVDGGDDLKVARSRSANPKVVTASCIKIPRAIPKKSKTEPRYGGGESGDQSLTWEWGYSSAGNIRVFSAYLWDGRRTVDAIDDVIFLK